MKKQSKSVKMQTRGFITQKNDYWKETFHRTPYQARIILVPQCLRNSAKCKAKDCGSYFLCAECGACKINLIAKTARKLGFGQLYILKGGRAVIKLIRETKPKAILGVACLYEGELGIKECERYKIPVQFVQLAKDGCVNTDIDIKKNLHLLK